MAPSCSGSIGRPIRHSGDGRTEPGPIAISRKHFHEMVARSRVGDLDKLAEHVAEDPEDAVEFVALYTSGTRDALDGKPPAPAPAGFPDELI